ncbi:MAG: putative quinol monooxygenase [Burkholderiales bacterium]
MPFMLKIQWDIKSGKEAEFKTNQEKLCQVMLEHPGVICYHVDYPAKGVSQWVEIYATDEAFAAHLDNEKGKEPLGAIIGACDKITCQCWGNPSAASKKILAGFGATYETTATNSFVLNPKADRNSRV